MHVLKNINLFTICNKLIVLLLVVFTSCVEEEFDGSNLDKTFDYESGLATPIGYRTFTMEDFFEPNDQRKIIADENGLLTLFYETTYETPVFGDTIKFEDTAESGITVNASATDISLSGIGDSLVTVDTVWMQLEMTPALEQDQISVVLFSSLDFSITTSSEYWQNVSRNVHIPTLTSNDGPYARPIQSNGSYSENLTEYELELQSHEGENNYFPLVIRSVYYPSANVIPADAEILEYDISFTNFEYEVLYGRFMGYFMDLPVTELDLNLYETIPAGSFHFSRPELAILTENSVGLPVGISLQINGTTIEAGEQNFEGEGVPGIADPWVYNYPERSMEGETVQDSLIISHDQWAFPEQSLFGPEVLFIEGALRINPYFRTERQFITRESKTKFDFRLKLPLYGYAEFMAMPDTMAFLLEDFFDDNTDELQKAFFRFYITNGFPVSFDLQVYLADAGFTIVDSLFTERQVIEAAVPNATGAEPVVNDPIIAEASREKLTMMHGQVQYLISNVHLKTYGFDNNPPMDVGIYEDQFLEINLGLVLDLKKNSDDP